MKCCLKNLLNFILLLVLVFIGFQVLFIYYLQPIAIEKITEALERRYHFSEDGLVVIKTAHVPYKLPDGSFGQVTARADKAEIEGLAIEDFRLHMQGCQIDIWNALISGDVEFVRIGDSSLSFKASQDAITSRWASELEKNRLTDISLELGDGKATVNAKVDLEFTTIPISATGTVEATEDGQVLFTATEVGLGEADINVTGIKSAFKTLSPIIDVGKMDFPLYVNSISIKDHYLSISASSVKPEGKVTPEEPAAQQPEDGSGAVADQASFIERLKVIAGEDEDKRREELGKLYEEMKAHGIRTQEQVKEYVAEQSEGLKDEYKWLLVEINSFVASQIESLESKQDDSEKKEEPENSNGS